MNSYNGIREAKRLQTYQNLLKQPCQKEEGTKEVHVVEKEKYLYQLNIFLRTLLSPDRCHRLTSHCKAVILYRLQFLRIKFRVQVFNLLGHQLMWSPSPQSFTSFSPVHQYPSAAYHSVPSPFILCKIECMCWMQE